MPLGWSVIHRLVSIININLGTTSEVFSFIHPKHRKSNQEVTQDHPQDHSID